MLSFGLGDYIAGAIRPHVIYMRRQGISLAVAAVFALGMVLFLLLALFLALTYVLPPFWAAVLCALLCALVAAISLAVVKRRAELRQRAGSEAVAIEEGKADEAAIGTLLALRGLATAVVPAAAIGTIVYLVTRRNRR